jgi:hypothetical protein
LKAILPFPNVSTVAKEVVQVIRMVLQSGRQIDMGSIILTIKKSDLSRHNVVKVDKSDTFRPYLLVNLDRAYIYLCGKEIIAESRDFVMTGKQSIIAEYKKMWGVEGIKKLTDKLLEEYKKYGVCDGQ